jgi:F-type H+-transporting ATPase subunit gamma
MPSTRDIRRRIKSVKNTAQITKAMQMVASSKMRKAQLSALAGRPYAGLMNNILAHVSGLSGDFAHPLMEKREDKKRAVLLVSTDKGLCGALNSNLTREAAKFDKDTTVFVCAGKKGAQFVSRTRRKLAAEFTYKDAPLFAEAHKVSEADFAAVAGHGFSDDDIWDIAAIAAFFALSNRLANVTAMRPNAEFYLMGRLPK